jgi:hypothetical protein
LDQTFFGYNSSDRIKLHEQLFEIIWAGDGKWNFDTIYHMPLPMRRFWIQKLNEKIAAANTNNPPPSPAAPAKMPVTKRPS